MSTLRKREGAQKDATLQIVVSATRDNAHSQIFCPGMSSYRAQCPNPQPRRKSRRLRGFRGPVREFRDGSVRNHAARIISPPARRKRTSVSLSGEDSSVSRWFAEEVQPHERALRSFLRARFPTLTDVDDLVQDAYARLVRARVDGKVAEARPYLFAIARNAAVDLCRRNRAGVLDAMVETDSSSVVDDRPNAAEHLSQEQELALLEAAIQALPGRCRRVVTLRKIHGLSHRAIAERLNISENTVSAQVTIAVFRIRNYLVAHGVSRGRLSEAQRQSG